MIDKGVPVRGCDPGRNEREKEGKNLSEKPLP